MGSLYNSHAKISVVNRQRSAQLSGLGSFLATEITHLPRAQAVSPRQARGPNGVPGEFAEKSREKSQSSPCTLWLLQV
jgi:hypothetical protein